MKSGEIVDYMFNGLKKNAITEWYDNYDSTEQIPSVFPSIGYWNIVNGCQGIAVAMATSVPQFNLKEVNDALIRIIKNPDVSFNEIYCAPDFATGGLITNADEVRESLKNGKGKSIRLRAKMTYLPKEHALQATELPYGVFTNTVVDQLASLVNDNPEYGIDKVIDYTKQEADIRIYLSKGQNPDKMIAKLYHDTMLENHYSINMILLDKGRFPKIFGWRDACDAYITHIRECKRNMIQFDLDKALARENIVNGLLLAVANIDDIVAIIRASESPKEAAEALIARYKFNKPQVEAILAMKLSALTRIDGVKLNEELEELVKFIAECRYILNEPAALDEKLIEALNNVSQKFGDARRTRVENILGDEEEPEEIKEEDVIVLQNGNNIKIVKKGEKCGRAQESFYSTNLGSLILITDSGKMYSETIHKIKYNQVVKLTDIFPIGAEKPLLLIDGRTFNAFQSITCVTKNGFIKKSRTSEYLTRAKKGIGVIKLDEDTLVSIILSSDDDDKVVIVSNADYYNCYSLSEIGYTGRMTKGVKAIKLDKDGYVKQAFSTSDDKYKITGRAVKGVKNG